MTNLSILDLLRSDGSIVVNKKLAHTIGLHEALIYSELVSLYQYWSSRDQLTEGEWFFCTIDNLEENTTLKRDAQSRAIGKLEKNWGLIETKRMGLPAKRYFRITEEILRMFSDKKSGKPTTARSKGSKDNEKEKVESKPRGCQVSGLPTTGIRENRQLEYGKTDTNNTRTNNTRINNTDLKNKESINLSKIEEKKHFVTPENLTPVQKSKNLTSEKPNEPSFAEQLNDLEVPTKVKQVIKRHQKRIITDGIFLIDIDLAYNSKLNDLTEHDFCVVLNNSLRKTKGKIQDITNLLTVAVEKYYIDVVHSREATLEKSPDFEPLKHKRYNWLEGSTEEETQLHL